MATIVERPLSAFSMSASPTAVPQRRRRESVEIIDVDSFEETDTRPPQRRRVEQDSDIIELLDSDDELELDVRPAGGSGSSGHRRGTRPASSSGRGQIRGLHLRAHSRRQGGAGVAGSSRQGRNYVSPPPPFFPNDQSIPPVPPFPSRFSAFRSFPPQALVPRPRAPRVSPPPTSNLNPRAGPRRRLRLPPCPRARHNPPMGLGGALISTNNARVEAERLERLRRGERRAAGGRVAPAVALAGGSGSSGRRHNAPEGNSIMRRLASLNPFRWGDDAQQLQRVNEVNLLALAHPGGDERTREDAQIALDLYLADQEERMNRRFAHPARGFARHELALLRGWAGGAAKDDEDYKREWTHPGDAEAGFVYDFAPSEIVPAVSGKGKGKEVVIDVDAEKEGVSTLLVCARCLDPLLVRSDGITDGGEEEARRRKVWGLRCGHLIDGKCFEELRKPVEVPDADATYERRPSPEPEADVKGKGKAKAVVEEEEPKYDELFDEEPAPSIRSRLRPRTSGGSTSTPSAFEIAAPLPPPPPSRKRAPPKRKGKGKGKARPKKPVVEARYEWACPVAGCARVHVSEKIDGVWGNAPDRGAIGMFV
ncbi:hypothetical protein B0H19DRAFT_1121887 [Mycena capillaripes]|nr:hypothetical protein B0H19DRAFT_1121887 [Mycena capillaripes]